MARIQWIDYAKGVTIFFVFFVHVIEGIYKTQLYPEYYGFLTTIMGIVFTFVMPIFFALSGYLYHQAANWGDWRRRIKNKAIGLLVPYIIFSIIFVGLQHINQGRVHTLYAWQSLLGIFWQPIGYLWFLLVLFYIFVLVSLLDMLKVRAGWQISLYLIGLCLSMTIAMPLVIQLVLMWTLPFYIGRLCYQYPDLYTSHTIFRWALLGLMIWLIAQVLLVATWYNTNMFHGFDFGSKLLSIIVGFHLFAKHHSNYMYSNFSKYGVWSMIIYLVHAPSASIIRTILLKFGVNNFWLVLGLTLVFTWCFSVWIARQTEKYTWLNYIFYPNRWRLW
ncbi:acyltransferase [Weissella diestrammenae]|uniref:Acyltransferase n=1 Tax=Weissella diestrammenae TaxID=1162633 RepID=A0A7G9T495_9LACO|nr:acyltransferase [Weissella diestrammenae]MCM0583451.1 acyltransferase [Weissella diestrammenae]QNN74920.1 acyltransferase [Weissella diestrammenae]